MKSRGGDLVVRALEDEGVRFTFGIPGTHNIELYDALDRSERISPVLVTDEQSASFMADAVSRTSGSLGVVNVVPGAGVTHCLSGVAEAFMDGVPLLVLTCGIRTDTGKAYQLHDIDQLAILRPVTKAAQRPEHPADIYSLIRRACALARSGTPGPVAIEIPANHYLMTHYVESLEVRDLPPPPPNAKPTEIDAAVASLQGARRLVIYAGNGASAAAPLLLELATKLTAPVATTIQGKGVFPEDHPLWLWCGLGSSAPPFVSRIAKGCDVMLAIGCRFGEVATASYGFEPPAGLIHVDINAEVLQRNYPARLAITSDAGAFLRAVLPLLRARGRDAKLEEQIAQGHREVREAWRSAPSADRVTPAVLFEELQKAASQHAIYVTDSGNGTFLAMEHLRIAKPGCFIGPIDYSCMGYSVPAAIGAKLSNPDRDVVALTGDGALLMTGLELATAAHYRAAPVVCVLRDGELGQIAAFQRAALDRDTCSILSPYSVEGLARATGSEHIRIARDGELADALHGAFDLARGGTPVLAEVAIDYSRKTYFTRGVVTTNFWRLPIGERMRFLGRAVSRRIERKLQPKK